MRRLVLILMLAVPAIAQETTSLVAAPASQLILEGSSNLAPWRCKGTAIEARMDVAAPLARINHLIDRIEGGNIVPLMADPAKATFPQPSFKLKVPVSALRCGNARMERDLSRALRSEEYPQIEFRFTQLAGAINHDIDRGTYHAKIAGVLSLAGATKAIRLEIEAQRVTPNRFRLRASLPLRMTDFAITPPTALFGAIKARDELLVRFDLMLQTGGAR